MKYQVVLLDERDYIITYTDCKTNEEVEREVFNFLKKMDLNWKISIKKWNK